MKESLFKALNIERNEQGIVLTLIIQSVFLGIFFGAFDILAHTLFLTNFGETLIPRAYIISGIVGILMTSIYTFFQRKFSFSRLILLTLLITGIIPFLLWLGYKGQSHGWIVFTIFILFGPLNIIAYNVAFWGMVGRLFSLRQGKRLFGIIGAGQIFGVIIASYTIPILPSEVYTEDLLLICAFSALIAFFIQIYISAKYSLDRGGASLKTQKTKKEHVHFSAFYKNKYIKTMTIFVVLSMIITFFVAYSFLAVANDKYPNENALKDFLSVFMGTLMIFGFLVKSFVYSKLMKNYGLKISLAILPVILLVFTFLSILSGTFLAYRSDGTSLLGASGMTSQFMFFFLLISLSRLFSLSLRDSIEIPAFKTLYQSLNEKIRYDVQAKIDGVVNEFSALFAGILLMVFSYFFSEQSIYFSYVTIIILIVWLFITFALNNEYKQSLHESLRSSSDTNAVGEYKYKIHLNLKQGLQGDLPDKVLYTIMLIKKIDPIWYENHITDLLEKNDKKLQLFAIKEIEQNIFLSTNQYLKQNYKKFADKKLTNQIELITNSFKSILDHGFTNEEITALTKSKETIDRRLAAKVIMVNKDAGLLPYLQLLLRDYDSQIVCDALSAAAKFKTSAFLGILVEFIDSEKFYAHAIATMIKIGEPALEALENAFHKTGIKTRLQLRIIRTITYIGGPRALELLLSKLQILNREITREIILGLNKNNFVANESQQWQFNQAIKKSIEIIAWNINIIEQLIQIGKFSRLKEAIEEGNKHELNFLFLLLSTTYDTKIISSVKKNLEIGTSESIGFAIEILDLFVDEDIKPLVINLFEDMPVAEKIRGFQEFFPLDEFSERELLYAVVNRDINFISNWTKACAIVALLELPPQKDDFTLRAQMFNKHPLLYEISATVLYKQDLDTYYNCLSRLSPQNTKVIKDSIRQLKQGDKHLIYSKMIFLKQIQFFKELRPAILLLIAVKLEEDIFDKTIEQKYDNNAPFSFIYEGKISVKINDETHENLFKENIFDPLRYCYYENLRFIIEKGTTLYSIDRDVFDGFIFDRRELLDALLKYYDV